MSTSWLKPHHQQFAQLINRQTLPHAILITGVRDSGKAELAAWLSQFLLCERKATAAQGPCHQCKSCHLHAQETHPDLRKIELQGASISVEQVRQASKFLEQKAQLAKAQVVVIEQAEKLTESAANALLKTLEEPTAHSYIILQSLDAERLLPTIVSRCQTYAIRPPVGAHLSASLQLSAHDPFSNLSHLAELSDPELSQQFNELKQLFLSYLNTGQGRMQLVERCQNQEHSLRWLEKVIADNVRTQSGWGCEQASIESTNKDLSPQANEIMWQCYLILKAINQKSLSLAQFNQSFGIEKLFAQMHQLLNKQEQVWNHSI